MTTRIERRPHQIDALTELHRVYSTTDRAQLHWTCGAGKTLVGRWLAEDVAASTVLVVLPSLALVAQTLAEWQTAAGWLFDPLVVCSDPTAADGWRVDPEWWADRRVTVTTDTAPVARFLSGGSTGRARVVFSTYHSLPVVARAARQTRTVLDLVICDEAHRLAGEPDARFRLALDDRRIPARRRLFMTATPVVTRIDADTPWTVLSMDDTATFGPVAHRYSLQQAIADDRSCDYRVVVLDASGGADGLTWEQRAMAALATAASQYGLTRIISFHARVARARAAAAAADGTVLPDGRTIRAVAVAGTDPTAQRTQALQQLADSPADTVAVVSNARCLAEGLDIPAVDAVEYADPKDSATEIVQGAGRAMRPAPGKTHGTIIIPVAVPTETDDDTYLSTGPFATVWAVLRALRDLDSRMAVELDRLYHRPVSTGHREPRGSTGRVLPAVTFDLPDHIDVNHLLTRIVTAQANGTDQAWDEMFALLRQWATDHGHTAIPGPTIINGRHVGRFALQQRAAYQAGALRPDRATRLETIPFWGWTADAAHWSVDYAAVHTAAAGGLRLADPDWAGTPLPGRRGKGRRRTRGEWCAEQAAARRNGELDDRHASLCEQIPGWTWTPLTPADTELVDILADWVATHGDANVPAGTRWGGLPLGDVLDQLRRRRAAGRLPQPLTDAVTVVTPRAGPGVLDWHTVNVRWDINYAALRQYATRTGGCDIPEGWVETLQPDGVDVALYDWSVRQRFNHRHDPGAYPTDRADRLEQIPGWTWEKERKTVNVGVGVRQHGTWLAYMAGCPCPECVTAAKTTGSALIDVGPARGHLRVLTAQVGRRAAPAAAAITGLNKKTIDGVIGTGTKDNRGRVHPEVAAAVLQLTAEGMRTWIEANPSPRDDIPAGPLLAIVNDMIGRGWSKAWISRELGNTGAKSLQIGRSPGGGQYLRRETADAIRRLDERLGRRRPPFRRQTTALPPLDAILAAEQATQAS